MNTYIIAQILGYIGLACTVVAFQCKKHNAVMILKTSNEFFFAMQYFLLGTYTGMAMNLVSSARNLIFAQLIKKGKSTLPFQILFCIFFIAAGILTWQSWISLLIILAKLLTTVVYGMKNTKIIRFGTVPTSIFWLVYNFTCHSSAGVLCEIFALVSITTAIIRIDIIEARKKKQTVKN